MPLENGQKQRIQPDMHSELAWKSFARFMTEPEHTVALHKGADVDPVHLSDLVGS